MSNTAKNISTGVKYDITDELCRFLKELRGGLSTEKFSEMLNKKPNTYNNLENKITKTITYETLMDIFEALRQIEPPREDKPPLPLFIRKKCGLYMKNHILDNFDNQLWLFALMIANQEMKITMRENYFKKTIYDGFTDTDAGESGEYDLEVWKRIVESLNENKHIKKLQPFKIANQIYVSDQKVGKYNYWAIKYELPEQDIELLANKLYNDEPVPFPIFFTLLFNALRKKQKGMSFPEVYADTYERLDATKLLHFFYEASIARSNAKAAKELSSPGGNLSILNTIMKLSRDALREPDEIQLYDNCKFGQKNFMALIAFNFENVLKNPDNINDFKQKLSDLLGEYK